MQIAHAPAAPAALTPAHPGDTVDLR